MANAPMRHVGKLKNSDRRCAVVLMQLLPDDPNSALIIDMDGLPPMYHDAMLSLLESPEAQQTVELHTVMSRRNFHDEGNMLMAFHNRGLFRKVPVDNVVMYPFPNQPFPLIDILVQQGRIQKPHNPNVVAGYPAPQTSQQYPLNESANPIDQSYSYGSNKTDPNTVKFNPFNYNSSAQTSEEKILMAKNLIAQAELLESDARRFREQAYGHAPELRPQVIFNQPVSTGYTATNTQTLPESQISPISSLIQPPPANTRGRRKAPPKTVDPSVAKAPAKSTKVV